MGYRSGKPAASSFAPFQLETLEGRRMLSAAPAAPGTPANMVRFTSTSAEAEFSYYDSTGTILTEMQVTVSKQTTASPGAAPVDSPLVSVILIQFDFAHVAWLRASQGSTADVQSMQLDPNLKSAHVKADVPMQDQFTGSLFNLSVDLTWAAAGSRTTTSNVAPSYTLFDDATRPMTCTGTAIADGINYAPTASLEAVMIRSQDISTFGPGPASTLSSAADIFGTATPILA